MTAKRLRAVAADEAAPRRIPKTVSQAVEWGTARDLLVVLRVRIATAVEDPNIRGSDLAALSRRLLEISRELGVLDAVGAEPKKDELPGDARFDPSSV